MGRVRVFYGHEGVVPPTGFRPRSAAAPAPAVEEVDEIVADDLTGAPVELVGDAVESVDESTLAPASIEYVDGREVGTDEDGIPVLEPIVDEADADEADAALPDDSWTKGDLLAYAEERGIDMTGATKTKPAALARVLESIEGE